MIELSLTELALAAVGLSMVLVVFFAWVSRWSHANAERRSLRQRCVCRLCLAVFESPPHQREVVCPECGAKTGPEGPRPLG